MIANPTARLIRVIGLAVWGMAAVATPAWSQPRMLPKDAVAHVLTLEQSVAWALQNNPELAVFRQQRGIACAGVVIARTYPFNPVWGSAILRVNPPAGESVANHVFQQHTLSQEIEFRGQGRIRRNVASAALSRIEWEIATQEQHAAIRTVRAFNAYLYQQAKLKLLEETIALQADTSDKAKRLLDQGKLKAADLMLARSDEADARAQRGSRQLRAIAAWHDLQKIMGVQKEVIQVNGGLGKIAPAGTLDDWSEAALQQRPELLAAHMAFVEAQQRERLEIANRFGNAHVGVKTEYDDSRIFFVGPTIQIGVPVLNTKRGQILQRQAETTRAVLDKQRVETQIQQDVRAAADRLKEAKKWVGTFEDDILPALQKSMDAFDKLFAQGEPSVDVLRLIEVRRRHLRARDSYLDALWELNQARADLAAAIGDFTLALDPPPALPKFGVPE